MIIYGVTSVTFNGHNYAVVIDMGPHGGEVIISIPNNMAIGLVDDNTIQVDNLD